MEEEDIQVVEEVGEGVVVGEAVGEVVGGLDNPVMEEVVAGEAVVAQMVEDVLLTIKGEVVEAVVGDLHQMVVVEE